MRLKPEESVNKMTAKFLSQKIFKRALIINKQYPILFYCILFVVASSISVFFLYFKLWRSYFSQDEWFYFGLFNPQLSNPLGFIEVFIQQFTMPKAYGIHFTPLWNSVFFLEYQLFGVKYQYYALLAMALHIVTAILVFLLAYKLSKSKLVAFVSGFYFTVSASLYEGLTWANAHLQAQLPSILVILSLLLWFDGLEKTKLKLLANAVVLIIAALLIKESVFGMFFLMFCMIFLYGVKKVYKKSILVLTTGFLTYTFFRVIAPFIALQFDSSSQMASPFPKLDAGPIVFRLVQYPFKAILLHFVSEDTIIWFSEQLTHWNYPNFYGKDAHLRTAEYINFIYSAGADIAMIILAIPVGIFLWYIYQRLRANKNKGNTHFYVFSLTFIVGSVIPLVFIAPWLLTLFPYLTFIESRYFYLIAIGLCMLFAIILRVIVSGIYSSRFSQPIRTSILFFFYLFLGLFFVRELYATRSIVSGVISTGEERHIIVDYIKTVHPILQNKSVFFLTSNKQYFGYADTMVPFQTNFGSALLDIYYREMHYDYSFYKLAFLIEKGASGENYGESDGKGFGYFIHGKSLLNTLEKYNLSVNNVYAFHYDGDRRIISSISDEVRARLVQEQKYAEQTKGWQEYRNADDGISFLYPPHYSVENSRNSTHKSISLVNDTGNTLYKIIIPIDKKIKMFDDVPIEFKKMNKDWDKAISNKGSRYFSNLEKRDVIALEKDNEERYFFFHPKNYIILRIDLDNSEAAQQSEIPLDLFLWSIKFD